MLAAAALAACDEARVETRERLDGRVVAVSDGDTIRVRLDSGRVERVRYIGIDTPEVDECFADRATEFNERLVGDREVELVLDVDERDRYGRLLAYVYARGRFVNDELVRRGFAQPLTVPPNVTYETLFRRLAAAARRDNRGLWGSCAS